MATTKEHKLRPTKGQLVIHVSTTKQWKVEKPLSNGCVLRDLDGIETLEVPWKVFSNEYAVQA